MIAAPPAWTAEAPGAIARRAAEQLDLAARAMARADGARDRVAALTGTVRAYEAGLSALRAGIRQASVRLRQIDSELEARRDETGQLLAALQVMAREPGTALLLHPAGPLGTARAGMMIAEVAPALAAQAATLRAALDEMATLKVLQASAQSTLTEGLHGVQQARLALAQAVSERTDLPRRMTEDTERMQQLINSAETLQGFADSLTGLPGQETDLPDFAAGRGALALPVAGRVLRGFGEADAAGIRRPGLIVAAAPGALVTTPWPATIRYVGPLLDYANVIILEPGEGYLLVLAGLGAVYGEAGLVVPAGAPLGLMPGADQGISAAVQESVDDPPVETLYMELRDDQTPQDPADWFALDEE
ncbi:murein hydrolase activator EnvC family protein [Profundibacterium mesophilum]|nr:peptidase M23 [Profundibacterium mesophilum]